eukprot:PhM_4_TR9415/c0_g1_i1/m.54598
MSIVSHRPESTLVALPHGRVGSTAPPQIVSNPSSAAAAGASSMGVTSVAISSGQMTNVPSHPTLVLKKKETQPSASVTSYQAQCEASCSKGFPASSQTYWDCINRVCRGL